MSKETLREITQKYALSSQGTLVEGTLSSDLTIEAHWTDRTWEDGVPVTKNFERNESVTLKLDEGTTIVAAKYKGFATGCPVVDFRLNGIWYSARRDDAAELLAEIDENFNIDDYDR